MAVKNDFRRRALGVVFLLASVAMLIVGETALKERLRSRPAEFLVFWMVCVGFVSLSVLVALLDMMAVRRRLREEQRELLEETIGKIAASKQRATKNEPAK